MFYFFNYFKIPLSKRSLLHHIILLFSFSLIIFNIPMLEKQNNQILSIFIIIFKNQFIILLLCCWLIFINKTIVDQKKIQKNKFYGLKKNIICVIIFLILNLLYFIIFYNHKEYQNLKQNNFFILIAISIAVFVLLFITLVFHYFIFFYFFFFRKKKFLRREELFLFFSFLGLFFIIFSFLRKQYLLTKIKFEFSIGFYLYINLYVISLQIFWRVDKNKNKELKNKKKINDIENDFDEKERTCSNLEDTIEKNEEIEIQQNIKNLKVKNLEFSTNQEFDSLKDLKDFK